jgi:2'-5' RNA ligase
VAEQVSRRLFFALWPDAAVLDELGAIAESGVACCGGRRMQRDTLHMTLAFLGNVSEARLPELLGTAGKLRSDAFEVVLDRLGWWPHNRILWMGYHSTPSPHRRLHDGLVQALRQEGFLCDFRTYHPHLTLARNARCAQLPPLPRAVRWLAREMTLVESLLQATSVQYRILARWPLESLPSVG